MFGKIGRTGEKGFIACYKVVLNRGMSYARARSAHRDRDHLEDIGVDRKIILK